jgi:3-phenylpropionate/trans-cinnamate dioxygenase ferredoxin reductase subunit
MQQTPERPAGAAGTGNPAGTIVIVGAGQAGAMAAAALRERGHAGRIVMLGREAHPPYERPPLSKEILCAEAEPRLGVLADDAFEKHAIEWRGESVASGLDLQRRELRLADGSVVSYDRCLLATGGSPRVLPALPPGLPGVHYLRTLDEARRLRACLSDGCRVVVVGGGFLGLELASSALRRGASVHILEAAPRLLDRFLPPECSSWLADRARQAGAQLHLATTVAQAEAAPGADGTATVRLQTADGRDFEADVVVVAVGLAPDTALARDAGLAIDPANGGIVVDARCRTSDPFVFAAGDCASQHRSLTGSPARYESWQNANEQGRAAAAGMLGQDAPPEPYPWFWTDQFGVNLQMLGLAAPDLAYVPRGNPGGESPRAIWLGHRDGVPVHAIAVNAGGDLRQMRVLFERRLPLDPAAFADPSNPLRAQVKAAQKAAAEPAAG